MQTINNKIKTIILDISERKEIDGINFKIEKPKTSNHGDFSCNIAFLLSKKLGKNPIHIANRYVEKINNLYSDFFDHVEIAGPGFINMFLSIQTITTELEIIINQKNNYGKNKSGQGQTALVEFVSANPTGPLTVGHGRGAIIGDTVSNILQWNGYSVDREYYFNNAGKQMKLLAYSVYARYLELLGEEFTIPEGGYEGEYIKEIAQKAVTMFSDQYKSNIDVEKFKSLAERDIFSDIKNTLDSIGIKFDNFYNEHDLYIDKSIYKVIEKLDKKGLIYYKDGATWFELTKLGKDTDRVLVKSSGEPTYRLPDIAYHITKFERCYNLIVDVFGADHMDAYPDVISALSEMDYNKDIIRVILHQFVTLTKNGKPAKMSTRKANFITIDQLSDEIGSDVLRYFFLMRGANTHLQFDLNIAKSQSDENPVFYIQYAYARICNLLNRYESLSNSSIHKEINVKLLSEVSEREIIIMIISFPDIIHQLKLKLEPQILANYLYDLSGLFHKYYANHKIITDNKNITQARTTLSYLVGIVLKSCLDILGISSPSKM